MSTCTRCSPGASARATAAARHGVVPALARAGTRVPRAALPDVPRPVRRRSPLVVTVHDLAFCATPSGFNRWTRTVLAPGGAACRAEAASRVIAVSEFTARRAARAARRAGGRDRALPNAVEDVFTPEGPRQRATTSLAVGTLEPRKNLAPDRCRRRRASCASSVRAAGATSSRRDVTLARRGHRRRARLALPRRTLSRLRRRCSRASASRSPRRSPAAARRHERREPRWRSWPATTPSSSIPAMSRRSAPGSRALSRPGIARRRALARGASPAATPRRPCYDGGRVISLDRRRRSRPPAHRRRDLRPGTCSGAARVAPDLRFAAVTRQPRARARRRRAARASRPGPRSADGLLAAAPAAPPVRRSRISSTRCRSAGEGVPS